MRIAVLASSRHPVRQPFAGGLESHVWHLARALHRRGHEVTLFAAPGSDPDVVSATLRVRTFDPSTRARHDPSMPAPEFLAEHHAYLHAMTTLGAVDPDRFDVVHNHSLHYLPLVMAPTLPIPMLTTLHTPPTPWLESALDVSGGRGSRFVGVSEHTARAWRHVVGDIDVVPNGIDIAAWPLGDGGTDAVWFGRITPEKAPHCAIDAARRAGVRLHLAGPISDRAYFRDTLAPELDDTVVYHGHLSQPALAELVGGCGVALVTPRWDEPYGLVVAEALACGTPVAGFERGGIPEIVDADCARLVTGDDTVALAAAIPRAAALDRAAAREHAIRRCSHRAMVDRYLALYRRMVLGAATTGIRRHRSTA